MLSFSWGKKWGLNGYMKLAKDWNNLCQISSYAQYPIVWASSLTPTGKHLAGDCFFRWVPSLQWPAFAECVKLLSPSRSTLSCEFWEVSNIWKYSFVTVALTNVYDSCSNFIFTFNACANKILDKNLKYVELLYLFMQCLFCDETCNSSWSWDWVLFCCLEERVVTSSVMHGILHCCGLLSGFCLPTRNPALKDSDNFWMW